MSCYLGEVGPDYEGELSERHVKQNECAPSLDFKSGPASSSVAALTFGFAKSSQRICLCSHVSYCGDLAVCAASHSTGALTRGAPLISHLFLAHSIK